MDDEDGVEHDQPEQEYVDEQGAQCEVLYLVVDGAGDEINHDQLEQDDGNERDGVERGDRREEGAWRVQQDDGRQDDVS